MECRALCQKCFSSNVICDLVNGQAMCFKCQGKTARATRLGMTTRKCADCNNTFPINVPGGGKKQRCKPCSDGRRLALKKGYDRDNYNRKINKTKEI